MRSCILIAVACILIPAAALAHDNWQRTSGNRYAEPAGSIQRTGPGHHIVGPTAALQRLFDGAGFHIVGPKSALLRLLGPGNHVKGPTAALLGLSSGGRYHLLGPEAAPYRRAGTREWRQGSAE